MRRVTEVHRTFWLKGTCATSGQTSIVRGLHPRTYLSFRCCNFWQDRHERPHQVQEADCEAWDETCQFCDEGSRMHVRATSAAPGSVSVGANTCKDRHLCAQTTSRALRATRSSRRSPRSFEGERLTRHVYREFSTRCRYRRCWMTMSVRLRELGRCRAGAEELQRGRMGY